MTYGLKTIVPGPVVAPNLALAQSVSDDIDNIAAQFGSDLLIRIDPRDVIKTSLHPTGSKKVHKMAPNSASLVFEQDAGISVGPVSGLYSGRDVFKFDRTGANDLRIAPGVLNSITSFSIMGVTHFNSDMFGAGVFAGLFGMYRDSANLESAFAYQQAGGINYLSIYADQGDGGGANHTIDGSSEVAAGTPFAFLWQVDSGVSTKLYVDQLSTTAASASGAEAPETGSIELYLGHFASSPSQNWHGALGRTYLFSGDILDTADKANLAADLMLQLQVYYAV